MRCTRKHCEKVRKCPSVDLGGRLRFSLSFVLSLSLSLLPLSLSLSLPLCGRSVLKHCAYAEYTHSGGRASCDLDVCYWFGKEGADLRFIFAQHLSL